ncbi:MAG: peptidoglycan bridge formation glycyltransferase FemA/FemB family protein [Caldilineales bacterium]|nr:peptidoglycan bridge formation glycyltransferase FemA/FemB family protein [Caldilineales bacterium]
MEVRNSAQTGWSEDAWDRFVESHPSAHPLQLAAWGFLKRGFGWEDVRLGLWQDGALVAGTQILFRRPPRLGFVPVHLAYIPKGPLVDWGDAEQAQALLDAIWAFCRRWRCLLVKIEPEARDSGQLAGRLRTLGYRSSPRTVQPRTTLWLDLQPDEETLLADMKQKWRYNIRLAGRKGVAIRQGDESDLATFCRLMESTGERNEFGVHSPAYFQRFWQAFAPGGRTALLLAEHEGEALAGLIVTHLAGKAYYLYGASGNEKRQLMPSHLLQWETMRWAKAQNCTAYDFWGIPDEVGLNPDAEIPDPATELWGVWRFKQGFGGEIVRYTGAWDRSLVPMLPL